MNELKISVLIMRKKMLFSGEIYLQKFYTAAGSDGRNKYHLCTRLINYNYEDIWGVEA